MTTLKNRIKFRRFQLTKGEKRNVNWHDGLDERVGKIHSWRLVNPQHTQDNKMSINWDRVDGDTIQSLCSVCRLYTITIEMSHDNNQF